MKAINRLTRLETAATVRQRKTVSGLVHLLETGRLGVEDCTDDELERLVSSLPGPSVELSNFTDAELERIIHGGRP